MVAHRNSVSTHYNGFHLGEAAEAYWQNPLAIVNMVLHSQEGDTGTHPIEYTKASNFSILGSWLWGESPFFTASPRFVGFAMIGVTAGLGRLSLDSNNFRSFVFHNRGNPNFYVTIKQCNASAECYVHAGYGGDKIPMHVDASSQARKQSFGDSEIIYLDDSLRVGHSPNDPRKFEVYEKDGNIQIPDVNNMSAGIVLRSLELSPTSLTQETAADGVVPLSVDHVFVENIQNLTNASTITTPSGVSNQDLVLLTNQDNFTENGVWLVENSTTWSQLSNFQVPISGPIPTNFLVGVDSNSVTDRYAGKLFLCEWEEPFQDSGNTLDYTGYRVVPYLHGSRIVEVDSSSSGDSDLSGVNDYMTDIWHNEYIVTGSSDIEINLINNPPPWYNITIRNIGTGIVNVLSSQNSGHLTPGNDTIGSGSTTFLTLNQNDSANLQYFKQSNIYVQ
jgi:hypothetical protein